MKKVSVIIPLYNEEKYIKECLESVINQTYKNLEIIVVDDNSTDNSLKIVKEIKDKRIKVIKLKQNNGVANARNKGVEKATGDYICFLDSDDFWVKDKIKKQIKFIKGKAFIYSRYAYTTRDGKVIKEAKVAKKLAYKDALKNTCIFTSTVMFDMSKVDKEDLHMPKLPMGEDSYVWWNVLKKGITAYSIDEVLAYYRQKGKSLSSNKIKAVKCAWNLYRLQNLSIIKRIYYFSNYLVNATLRRIG